MRLGEAEPHRCYQHAPAGPGWLPRLDLRMSGKQGDGAADSVSLAANRSSRTGAGVLSTGPRAGASRSPQAGQAVHRALEEDRVGIPQLPQQGRLGGGWRRQGDVGLSCRCLGGSSLCSVAHFHILPLNGTTSAFWSLAGRAVQA